MATRLTSDQPGVEMGGFDHDFRRIVVDFGVEATHGAGEGNRSAIIGDEHIRGAQRALHMVKRLELLP